MECERETRETMNSSAARAKPPIVLNEAGVWRGVTVPTPERVEAGRRKASAVAARWRMDPR